jgi:hypothetical protein
MEVVRVAGTQHADAGASPPDVDVLVDGIQELLRMVRTVRQVGGSAQLPHRLVQVCREVAAEAEGHFDMDVTWSSGLTVEGVSEHVRDLSLREIPLRRLLWQVIIPGETSFRVPTIVERLAQLGMRVEPPKVSNALGYWVDRGRLVRVSKGVYSCPAETSTAGATDAGASNAGSPTAAEGDFTNPDQRRQGAGHTRRVAAATRRQEDADAPARGAQRRKAV